MKLNIKENWKKWWAAILFITVLALLGAWFIFSDTNCKPEPFGSNVGYGIRWLCR